MRMKLAIIMGAILLASAPNLAVAQCGDFNSDGHVDVGDMTDYVEFLWNGGPGPTNYGNADIDDYDVITMSDLVKLLQYLYVGGFTLTCPPNNTKLKGIPNANIYLDLNKKNYTSYPASETIQILLTTGQKSFVYLDLPLEIYVGTANPQKAQVVSVTVDPVFSNWSNVGPGYKIDPSGSLLLSFGDYNGSTLGPYSSSSPQLMVTVDISVLSNPGTDDKIYLKFDYNFPPVVAPYGSSHYPLMICSSWPKNTMEAYEPTLKGPAVPSITGWGLIILMALLSVSGIWFMVKRRRAVA